MRKLLTAACLAAAPALSHASFWGVHQDTSTSTVLTVVDDKVPADAERTSNPPLYMKINDACEVTMYFIFETGKIKLSDAEIFAIVNIDYKPITIRSQSSKAVSIWLHYVDDSIGTIGNISFDRGTVYWADIYMSFISHEYEYFQLDVSSTIIDPPVIRWPLVRFKGVFDKAAKKYGCTMDKINYLNIKGPDNVKRIGSGFGQ